ncbi:MAG: hydroxymethylbilane synthase, partial [Aliarcobacter cryaerophilus]
MEKLVISTRRSQLALWQSEYIKAELLKHYQNMEVEL